MASTRKEFTQQYEPAPNEIKVVRLEKPTADAKLGIWLSGAERPRVQKLTPGAIAAKSESIQDGKQVGKENRAKRHQKWHRKNDEKTKGNKMAKKSQQEALTTREGLGAEPWGGTHPY